MDKDIHELIKICNLGTVAKDIEPVSGGLMHKMFKVQTTTGVYAVKLLNSEIMKRSGVMENYAEAERLECVLEDKGIPVVSSMSFDGRKMIELNGSYFYIFKWQNGSITNFETISDEQCRKAGEILGRIHSIEPQNIEAGEIEEAAIDFKEYIEIAKKKNSSIELILEKNITLLETAQDKLNVARRKLPAMRAISNDDMDPKNVMWEDGNAYVIDLECLSYSNPISSCLDLSLQWSGTVNESFCKQHMKSFYEGYLSAYDNGFRSYDELFGIAYTWVEWLDYNIRRALGIESSNTDEERLGAIETENTINRILYLSSMEKEICSVLRDLRLQTFNVCEIGKTQKTHTLKN